MEKEARLWLEDSLYLFKQHRKTWYNFINSTVLIDLSYNIIAFYDNKSTTIDIIKTDVPFNWWFLIINWEVINKDSKLKYKPRWLKQWYKDCIKEGWNWDELRLEIEDYNINYFDEYWNSVIDILKKEFFN